MSPVNTSIEQIGTIFFKSEKPPGMANKKGYGMDEPMFQMMSAK